MVLISPSVNPHTVPRVIIQNAYKRNQFEGKVYLCTLLKLWFQNCGGHICLGHFWYRTTLLLFLIIKMSCLFVASLSKEDFKALLWSWDCIVCLMYLHFHLYIYTAINKSKYMTDTTVKREGDIIASLCI